VLVQTGQGQPIEGTPTLVPVPSRIIWPWMSVVSTCRVKTWAPHSAWADSLERKLLCRCTLADRCQNGKASRRGREPRIWVGLGRVRPL
jgi:hypothetical protein